MYKALVHQIMLWPQFALLLPHVGMQRDRRRVLILQTLLAQRRPYCHRHCPHHRPSSPSITTTTVLSPLLSACANTRVELPLDYNDAGTWPMIRFTSTVFNPMVLPTTGELDLKSVFPEWVPGKHYMVTALTYLKKVFYMKDFSFPRPANPKAQAMFQVTLVEGRIVCRLLMLLLAPALFSTQQHL